MRPLKQLAAATAISLLGLVPVAAVAPTANAIETAATSVTLTNENYYKVINYGDTTQFSAKVTDVASGETVYDGNTYLQASVAGGKWTNVSIAHRSGGFVLFQGVKPKEKTKYRIQYIGAAGYSSVRRADVQYTNSVSNVLTQKVRRKITAPKKGFTLKGKVSPKFKKKKIIIKVSKKQNKGFKKFRTIRTNKKGKYKTKLPKTRGVRYYKVIVKGDKRFSKTSYTWRTWVY